MLSYEILAQGDTTLKVLQYLFKYADWRLIVDKLPATKWPQRITDDILFRVEFGDQNIFIHELEKVQTTD